MNRIDYFLRNSLLEMAKEENIQIKGDSKEVVKDFLKDVAEKNILRRTMIEKLVNHLGDKLVEPTELALNLLPREDKGRNAYQSLATFLKINAGDILYFRHLEDEEELVDTAFYLIEWNGKKYLALFDGSTKRFAISEDDFAFFRYNHTLSYKSIKLLGRFEKLERK